MATSIQIKRGATAKVAAYTPLEGELVLDLTTKKLYVGDGLTAGGNQIVASRKGVTDGTDAAAGEIGEVLSASSNATPVTLTSGTASNLIQLTLTPGDWDIRGVGRFEPSVGSVTAVSASWNTTSATFAGFPDNAQLQGITAGGTQQIPAPIKRMNITTNTIIYLVGLAVFTSGTCAGKGFIEARRVR
ncbi:hypothetical protein [Pantoea cypripedii]|uniref:Major tropism determinant N-terminal domain-containing protein n=1 Tax=Pantoea cypripedii TaxID=55209 RepID=A0A6B9FZR2_PANCY|nr:hypothetical protein [Pantoea cypripedii]QGY29758.1 hypothetical protein CUN67_12790 [Pantoea cypripedii]